MESVGERGVASAVSGGIVDRLAGSGSADVHGGYEITIESQKGAKK